MPRILRLCIAILALSLGLAMPCLPDGVFARDALAGPANGAKQSADKSDKSAKDDAADASDASQPKDWQVLLSIHQDALVQQAVRFKSLEGLLPQNVRHFRTALSDLQSKLDALNLIISISGGNPWEMRAVLNDMGRLRQNAQALIDPFANSRDEIDKIATRLDSLKEEFSKHLSDGQDQALTDAITYYLNYIKGVRASLAKVRSALEKQLGPAKDFLESLSENEKALKARLPKAWKHYYFTPVGDVSSLTAWSETFASIQLWLRSNTSMVQSLIGGADSSRTLAALVRIAIGFFVLGLADFMAALRLRRRYPDFRELKQARRIWLMVGLGCLFNWVAGDAPLLLHEFLNALAEISLAAALVAFAEMLARAASPEGKGKPAVHLRRLWLFFSMGLLLQIGALPDVLMTAVWMALLLAFFLYERKKPAARTGPSHLAGSFTPALYIILCLMTAMGWQHLSVLALAGWFLFLAAIETGSGLSRLVAKWQDKAAREGAPIVTRAVVSGLGFPLIFLSLFFLVLYWFSTELGGQEVFAATVSFAVDIGNLRLSVGGLAMVLTGFFVTRSTVYVAKSFIRDLPRLQPGVDPGVRDVLDTTSTYLLWGLYALISLFLLGFSFTSLAVVAGGLSVGIGFGLQNIVNNFIAGLILLFGRSIQAGDVIQIDTIWGKVSKVNIRNTVVKTFQNATLFVPNSDLISGKLINWTHRDATMRRDITVGVAYGSDTGKVRDILIEVARAHPHVLQNPSPSVQFSAFGDSSLDFLLMVWVDNVAYGMDTESDIRFSIDRRFREESIEIPFPQCDVRIVREQAPAPGKTPPGDA
ncbi:MscS Mechanosensitive ion channel [Solidesulfovibrio fructosivorans JJ]]|uniref:MscS Mechanosensitive ion channel n=1 Tax=Solidesulfovibrio fructosivorans JJ] TaxID=596151 RepID=E1JWC7_SOLFR|nr:mechanosensitive ion channel domain-containing protein [Solidesulfovibrio fructosivorans]EFL51224.1 MscS Mechanosensitive ion channel [Solidesulfovibrio fructosivorans JJ]]